MEKELTYNQALLKLKHLCSREEKCKSDIKKKLVNWQFAEADVQSMLLVLEQEKYIDELRYTLSFVRGKFEHLKWGRMKIRYALKQKSIPESIIDEALAEINENVYLQLLEKELERKFKTIKNFKDKYEAKAKLSRFAISKGFEYELALQIIEKILK
jgi:regulatory protein